MAALAGAAAMAWIVAALFFRHEADTDPIAVRWAMSVLAAWFVVCGVWTYTRVQTRLSGVFLWYCALSGIHWGGPIGIGSSHLQSIELAAFVVVGSVLTQSVFLDLVLRMKFVADDRKLKHGWIPYLPMVPGGILFLGISLRPEDASLLALLSGMYALAVLMSLIGGLLLIARPFSMRENRLGNAIVAAAFVVGWLPHGLVSGGLVEANVPEGYFNLPLALAPLALAWWIVTFSSRFSTAPTRPDAA